MEQLQQELKEIAKILTERPTKKEVATAIKQVLDHVKSLKLKDVLSSELHDAEGGMTQSVRDSLFQEFGNVLEALEERLEELRSESDTKVKKTDGLLRREISLLARKQDVRGLDAKITDGHLKIKTLFEALEKISDGDRIIKEINNSKGLIQKERVEGLTDDLKRIEAQARITPGSAGGGKQLRAAPFSFAGDGSTTQFYLPTEPAGKGWFIFVHYQGQWLQKDVHYSIAGKVFDTTGGSSSFTPENGTVIEGFLIF